MSSVLTRVRYAGLDFNTHEDEILARLQVNFAETYNDFAVSSLGIMLVDVFSFGLDTMSFYLDRRATDNFLSTARTNSSAARLARQLGYKAGPASASSVDVEVSLASTYTFPVPIPFGQKFSGPSGLIFEAQESVTFPAGDTSTQTITLAEGETVNLTFTSNGTPNQVFEISNVPAGKFILGPGTDGASQTTVIVDGEEYEEQDLLVFGNTAQYEIGYNDSPPTLRFGDSIAGKTPEDGAEIQLTYFATSGVNGQATEGTITSLQQPLVVSFTSIDLNINNPEGTSGGSDPESLSSIKANAPSVFKSRGVNVTREDYEARAQSFVDPVFGAIAVARAVTVRGASDDAFLSSLLANINSEVADIKPEVDAAVDSICVSSDEIAAEVDSAQTDDDSLATSLAAIMSDEEDATTANETLRFENDLATTSLNELQQLLSNLVSDWISDNSIVVGTTVLSTVLKDDLDQRVEFAEARRDTAAGAVSDAGSNVDTVKNRLGSISGQADTSEALRASIRASLDAIETSNATLKTTALTLKTTIEDITDDVTSLTQQVSDHVDSFLSNECKSNLVEVPVLTLDSEGFYVEPTLGLQKSLQRHLDARKEVTQVVKVVGASNLLVQADVTAHVGILTGFNEATVRSQVEAAILEVLRGRKFGFALYLSELYAPVAPESDDINIDGVEFVNIKIVGPSDRVDADGNLPVTESEVVTRGVITITSEVVSESLLS